MSRAVERPQSFPLILFFCWISCRRGKWLSVRSVTSPCASLSVPAEESKGWSATIFYLLHSLIGNRKLISELKQSVELLKNSNELLQDAISGEIGSLKDEVKENTVQEVRKALQANIEAIQRATKLLEKQSDTLTSVMKQKLRELEESKNSFFRYEGLKLYLFWGGMVCNILVFLMLASSMFGR